MSDLIDKKALIEALKEEEEHFTNGPGWVKIGVRRILKKIKDGKFDAKPEPEPRPVPNEKIRSLPLSATKTRQYNMTSVDGQLAYLVDITDILLGFRNTHFEKDNKPLEKRVEQIEKEPVKNAIGCRMSVQCTIAERQGCMCCRWRE